jgi:PAS domain S-box-containing protein
MSDIHPIQSNYFNDYYDRGNDSGRLSILLLVFAFIFCPCFAFLFKYVGAPECYFSAIISGSLVFPFILVLERFVPVLKSRLPILYFLYFIGITMYVAVDLRDHQFTHYDFAYFVGLFGVLSFGLQRFWMCILYFVITLLTVAILYWTVENPVFDILPGLAVIACCGSFYSMTYYSRDQMINRVQDYNNYLKRIVNNPGNGIVLFYIRASHITVVDFNKEANVILKTASAEELENTFRDVWTQNEVEYLKSLDFSASFGKRYSFTNRNKIIELKVVPLKLKNGNYLLTNIYDISQQVREQNELKQNERKYRNLYVRNQAGVFTVDLNARIIDCNPTFQEIFEYTLGVNLPLFGNDKREEWDNILNILEQKESLRNHQTEVRLDEYNSKFLVYNFNLDKEQNLIEGTVVDITEVRMTNQALQQSEEKYRLIYEQSNDSILLLDDDRILDINQRGIQLFGKSEEYLIEKSLWDFSWDQSPESKKRYDDYFAELKKNKNIRFTWNFINGSIFIEASLSMAELTIGDQVFYQCVIRNVTQRNQNIRALQSSQRTFQSILENTPEGFLILKDSECVYANSEVFRIFSLRVSDPREIVLQTIFTGYNYAKFEKLLDEHLQDKKPKEQQLNFFIGGKLVEIDLTLVSTVFEEEEALLLIIKDVSVQNKLSKEMLRAELAEETNKRLAKEIEDRIYAENKLQTEFLRTKAIFDSSANTLLLTLTPALNFSTFNSHCQHFFEVQTESKMEAGMRFEACFRNVFTGVQLRYFRKMASSVKKGNSFQLEIDFVNKNKVRIWLELYLNPIFNTEGNVSEISLVAHDITDKKINEREIIQSLKEKEVLLKEVHHRVKNNLQVISSILNLQSSFIQDEKILDILEESRHRIRSMAIIHENLYRTTNFSSINFSSYIIELCRNLISSYQYNKKTVVVLKQKIEHVELNLDQAIPCGLIINELITNSMKYAFNTQTKGIIFLNLKERHEMIELTVGDNGIGLPDGFDYLQTDSLGLQLVVTLVEQLDGEIKVDNKDGIKYFITFGKQKL